MLCFLRHFKSAVRSHAHLSNGNTRVNSSLATAVVLADFTLPAKLHERLMTGAVVAGFVDAVRAKGIRLVTLTELAAAADSAAATEAASKA